MTKGTIYTIQSMEKFFGKYGTVLITPAYGRTVEVTGLLYPKTQGVDLSTERFNIYLINGAIQTYWIRDVSKITIEAVSPKTETALSRLYQTLLAENDSLIKFEQEELKMREKIKKMREKTQALQLKAQKQASVVTTSLGFISKDKMKQELEQILVAAGAVPTTDDLYCFNTADALKFRHYTVAVRDTNIGLMVDFYYCKDIEKWAQNSGYDFIYEEYDGTHCIGTSDSKDYRHLIEKHSRLLNSLTCKNLSSKEVKCSQSYSLKLGDKYWLSFEDRAQLLIEAENFTKDTLKTAQKTLRAFLKN